MNKLNWKSILPELIIVAVFIIASAIYFLPALQGQVIYGGDNINGTAAVQEGLQFMQQTGESTYWTNSMFAGMPNYQIGGYRSLPAQILAPCYAFFQWGKNNVFFIMFFYLLAFYILLRTFHIDKWISMAGAFAISLSSYFFIIIAATHNAKCIAITWMTLVLVGFLLIYQHRYVLGAILTMLFIPMGFFIHPQMGYYICMLIGVLFCAETYRHGKVKQWKEWGVATVVFATAFAVGLGIGGANFFANQEYASQTMRGGHSDLQKTSDEQNKVQNGLDIDYATAWSYGINETMTLLIPNYMGAASGYNLGEKSILYNQLVDAGLPKASARNFCQQAPTYWGEKPFTSGPVYIGAVICLLFLMALITVKGPYKWALLIATVFSIMLAWGHNCMWLTSVFFRYFPMYNKFRAVESILIVAEITMPLLACLGLQQLVNNRNSTQQNNRALYIATAITASVCLIFAIFGKHILSFTSSYDQQWKAQVGEQIYQMIISQRAQLLTADAYRSLAFCILTAVIVWIYINKHNCKTIWLGIALTTLIITDMWAVDKRFCNNDNFIPAKQRDKAFAMMPYEKQLLQDTTYFRVLNLTTNTFNEARTSYYLHSIGGYSAAKLRRYQDLIDEHISQMNWNVINMLNTKYIIVRDQNGQPTPQINTQALGNAWFVNQITVVDNPNQESEALRNINPRYEAVTDRQFADCIINNNTHIDTTATIKLTTYAPNRLTYESQSATSQTAVFSEIYYPYGWKLTIDGQPQTHFRVNYLLRAANIPAGTHQIVFTFQPDSVRKGNCISLICITILFATIIAAAVYYIYKLRKHETNS